MPNGWLEISLHPQGPAMGQIGQFSMVFLGPRKNSVLVRKIHVASYTSHTALSPVNANIKNSSQCNPPNINIKIPTESSKGPAPFLSSAHNLKVSTSQRFTFFTLSPVCQKDKQALPGKLQSQ
jgi:hypothetical protein